jgi:hypothetical protein
MFQQYVYAKGENISVIAAFQKGEYIGNWMLIIEGSVVLERLALID